MDPGVAQVQVQSVRRALAANVKLVADKALHLHDVFVYPNFSLDLTCMLEELVGDSVNLYARYGHTHKFVAAYSDFFAKQARRIHTAVDDITQLQLAESDKIKLATGSDAFVMDVVEDMWIVIRDNAFVVSEHQDISDTLFMCRSSFSSALVDTLRRVLQAHVAQCSEIGPLRDSCAAAEARVTATAREKDELAVTVTAMQGTVNELEQAVSELQEEVERSRADQAAQARAVVLEESLSALQEENVRLRMDAKSAEAVAQAHARKLEAELTSVHSAHLSCDMRLQGRDAEIFELREECKKVIAGQQEQLMASAETARQLAVKSEEKLRLELERNKLAAELSALKESYKSFSIFKAHECQRMSAEVVRLRQILKTGGAVLDDGLVEENMRMKDNIQTLRTELLEANTKLEGALENCSAWKNILDDVMSRHATEIETIRSASAKQREVDEGSLSDATRRIAVLEAKLREQIEASSVREAQLTEQGHNGLNLAFDGASAAPNRVQEIAVMPQVPVSIPLVADTSRVFTKRSLASIFGGFTPNVIGRCTATATELARNHGIREYLCPRMEHNACLPAGPGKHGYLHFGFGKDNALFTKGEYRHVFVGAGSYFLYYGFYHVLRVEPLSRREWASLPLQMKMIYSDLTVQKDKSDRPKTTQEVLADYESGTLRAPCVRLQCVAFDTGFYQEVIQANKEYLESVARRTNDGRGQRKRRRAGPANAVDDQTSEDEPTLASLTGRTGRKVTDTGSGLARHPVIRQLLRTYFPHVTAQER